MCSPDELRDELEKDPNDPTLELYAEWKYDTKTWKKTLPWTEKEGSEKGGEVDEEKRREREKETGQDKEKEGGKERGVEEERKEAKEGGEEKGKDAISAYRGIEDKDKREGLWSFLSCLLELLGWNGWNRLSQATTCAHLTRSPPLAVSRELCPTRRAISPPPNFNHRATSSPRPCCRTCFLRPLFTKSSHRDRGHVRVQSSPASGRHGATPFSAQSTTCPTAMEPPT